MSKENPRYSCSLRVSFVAVLLVFLSMAGSLYAGHDPQGAGARPMGMGGAYAGVRGSFWSLFYNPAGIAGMKQMGAGVHIERRFLLSQMNYGAFGFVYPFKKNHVAAVEGSGFGFGGYNEAKFGLTYATTFAERFSIGAKFNFAQTSIRNYGSATSFFVDLGINAAISKDLSLGVSVYNANQAYVRKEISEQIPTVFTLGLAYQASDKILVVSDFQKHVAFPFSYRGGVEYQFTDRFYARMGLTTAPVSFSAGLGFKVSGFDIDFANTYHLDAYGYSPQLSVTYQFGGNSSVDE